MIIKKIAKKILPKSLLNILKKLRRKEWTLIPIKIKFLKKGNGPETKRYPYQKKYIDFAIKKSDKVLDIGYGSDPFPLATHLADSYPKKLNQDKRPFTKCTIENTPFNNKEFDFVYCSHVLEHVENPAKACEEIMRIGKKGYIETPTRMSDILFNFTRSRNYNRHRWYINIVNNTIIFIAWRPAEHRDTNFNYLFKQRESKWQNPFQLFFHKNKDLFMNMFLWNNKFNYIVINERGKILNHNLNYKK